MSKWSKMTRCILCHNSYSCIVTAFISIHVYNVGQYSYQFNNNYYSDALFHLYVSNALIRRRLMNARNVARIIFATAQDVVIMVYIMFAFIFNINILLWKITIIDKNVLNIPHAECLTLLMLSKLPINQYSRYYLIQQGQIIA